MDRNFLGLFITICVCGKVAIVIGVGAVVGICRNFLGLFIALYVCGKLRFGGGVWGLVGGGWLVWVWLDVLVY